MDHLLVDQPRWLDWAWMLRVLDHEARLVGEDVRPAEGTVATACRLADRPLLIAVTGTERQLMVSPAADAVVKFVASRFHLGLDGSAVSAALERSGLTGLPDRVGWVRRPAAGSLWSYCLTFLTGGDPDAPAVRRMFAELGRPVGDLWLPPEPADLLTAGEHRVTGWGVAPHRAANVVGLARAFAGRPDRYDEVALRALPASDAVARVAELPHIGPTRAREIASTALGHDDVLPDLARQDEPLRRKLGLGWTEIRAAAIRAAPYRSVIGDTLLELLSD